jgi:hypothetical protein
MKETLMLEGPLGVAGSPPCGESLDAALGPFPHTLYITLGSDGLFKAGTCQHCVLEHGRPGRAWDANGDDELDFDRDTLLAFLAELGVVVTDRHAYVCP